MMTNQLSTEIGRLRAAEMVTRGRRYLEVNRPTRADAETPAASRGPRASRVLALAAAGAVVLPGLSLLT